MAEASAPAVELPIVNRAPVTPGILRRLAGMFYELLLLMGVLFISTYLFLQMTRPLDELWHRPLLQVFMLAVCGVYFVWLWRHGGQTLPMKTWHVRLVSADGGPVSVREALARYLLACALIFAGGIGIIWALFDRDRQFLYDRLAGTRLVNTNPR
jgi:uncharacterized RDD family membrane protein YckC